MEQKFKSKKRGRVNATEFRLDDMEREIEIDLEIWKQLRSLVEGLYIQPDRKLLELSDKLKEILDENHNKSSIAPPSKVLLFSYFRDTADYLEEKLTDPDSPYFVQDCKFDIITLH